MRFILSTLLVFTLGLGVLTACQKTAESVKTEAVRTTAQTTPPADAHQDDAPRISLADAKKDFDAGSAIFIDTRAPEAYKMDHIKGAINITLGDSPERYQELPKDKKIIVYCS